MMIVPNYVGPSAIEGVGIFAAAPIRAGQAIWILEEKFDLLLSAEDVASLDPLQREFIERYGYRHMTKPGMTVLEFDNGRFMNHNDRPNTDFRDPVTGYALYDIAVDEELTCNYGEFDPGFEIQEGRQFLSA